MPNPTFTHPEIRRVEGRIRPHVRKTPVLSLPPGSLGIAAPLVLKLEHLQVSGSFKGRGAFASLTREDLPEAGVIAASGGNHGAAVAYAARALGLRAEIFVPEVASPVKVARLRAYGAEVVVTGATYQESLEASQERARETGARPIHAYDQVPTVLGQATLGCELSEQAPEVGRWLVSVGGGGLLGGLAAWFRGERRLVGLEPPGAPSLLRAREVGEPVDVPVAGPLADSLGARRIGSLGFSLAREFVEAVHLVPEEAAREAQLLLWEELRLAVEPAATLGLAALLRGVVEPEPGEVLGLVLCGANLDPRSLVRTSGEETP